MTAVEYHNYHLCITKVKIWRKFRDWCVTYLLKESSKYFEKEPDFDILIMFQIVSGKLQEIKQTVEMGDLSSDDGLCKLQTFEEVNENRCTDDKDGK